MELSLEKIKIYLSKAEITDPEILVYLADAKRAVIRDGISEAHPDFDELQRFFAMGNMQLNDVKGISTAGFGGNASDKNISSFGVAGISLSYKANNSSGAFVSRTTGRSGYMGQYDELLRKLRGFSVIVE